MNVVTKKPADWTDQNIADFWDWHSRSVSMQNNYFASVMAPGIAKYLDRKGLIKGNILDYGCGKGHLLEQMIKIGGANFYGLDFSADSIAATRERTHDAPGLKELVVATHLPCSLNDASFDTITLIETIEHLQDDKLHATLNELHRLLKPGGKLFITTPFNEDLSRNLHFCPFCKTEFHHIQHMQSYTVERLSSLLQQHNFSIDYCHNINIEKFRIGALKFFVKSKLKKLAIAWGIMEKVVEENPNLLALASKNL
jgi:2-polyprenyl-3-methyl-5-hydroxy-6-metoxy-1,4-benzoquinol methylase